MNFAYYFGTNRDRYGHNVGFTKTVNPGAYDEDGNMMLTLTVRDSDYAPSEMQGFYRPNIECILAQSRRATGNELFAYYAGCNLCAQCACGCVAVWQCFTLKS